MKGEIRKVWGDLPGEERVNAEGQRTGKEVEKMTLRIEKAIENQILCLSKIMHICVCKNIFIYMYICVHIYMYI